MSDVRIEGERVALRPLVEEDLVAVEPWYAEAAAAVEGMASTEHAGAAGLSERLAGARRRGCCQLLAIVELGTGSVVGLMEFEDLGTGSMGVTFLAIAASRRGFGFGSEAVRLLEEEMLMNGEARRLRADVSVRNGLGVYFWLRVGYRPMGNGRETKGRSVLTMTREIGREGAG